jgi:alpha-tubulin suppressor-like RCC1 family protein
VIYFGSNPTTKQTQTPIATLAKTGQNLTFDLPADTVKPTNATHLLVFTKNADDEMGTGVYTPITDLVRVSSKAVVSSRASPDSCFEAPILDAFTYDNVNERCFNGTFPIRYASGINSNTSCNQNGRLIGCRSSICKGYTVWAYSSEFEARIREACERGPLIPQPIELFSVAQLVELFPVAGLGNIDLSQELAQEGQILYASPNTVVAYGKKGYSNWRFKSVPSSGQLKISVAEFGGDPIKGTVKAAYLVLKPRGTQISSGYEHSCSVMPDKTVTCWGSDTLGQRGDGALSIQTPTTVYNLTSVEALSSGMAFTCALMENSTVKCWGGNGAGQLGDGSTTNRDIPTTVTDLNSVISISSGANHTCALMEDTTVKCWGANSDGQIGDGSSTNRIVPTTVPNLVGVKEISAGYSHTCAVQIDGFMKCWGGNWFGQLGTGTTEKSLVPRLSNLRGGVQSVSAGANHSCAVLSDGSVECWGNNISGALGDGTIEKRLNPTVVPGLMGVGAVYAGYERTCARLIDSSVQCWGINTSNQLGDGSSTNRLSPTLIPSSIAVSSIATMGSGHTCWQLANNIIQCWGSDSKGQLGGFTGAIK